MLRQRKVVLFGAGALVVLVGILVVSASSKREPIVEPPQLATEQEVPTESRTELIQEESNINTIDMAKKETTKAKASSAKATIDSVVTEDHFTAINGTVADPVENENLTIAVVPTAEGRKMSDLPREYQGEDYAYHGVAKDQMTIIEGPVQTSRKGEWGIALSQVIVSWDSKGSIVILVYNDDTQELLEKKLFTDPTKAE